MKKLMALTLMIMSLFNSSAFAEGYTIKKVVKIHSPDYTKANVVRVTKLIMEYYTNRTVHLCTSLFDATRPYPVMGMKVDINYKNKKDGLYLDSFSYIRELLCKPEPVLRVTPGTEPMGDHLRLFVTLRKKQGVNDKFFKDYIRHMAKTERKDREELALYTALYCGMVGESPPYPYAYAFLTATYVKLIPFMMSRPFMEVNGWNWYGFVECFRTKKERDAFARIQGKRFGVEVK